MEGFDRPCDAVCHDRGSSVLVHNIFDNSGLLNDNFTCTVPANAPNTTCELQKVLPRTIIFTDDSSVQFIVPGSAYNLTMKFSLADWSNPDEPSWFVQKFRSPQWPFNADETVTQFDLTSIAVDDEFTGSARYGLYGEHTGSRAGRGEPDSSSHAVAARFSVRRSVLRWKLNIEQAYSVRSFLVALQALIFGVVFGISRFFWGTLRTSCCSLELQDDDGGDDREEREGLLKRV